MELRFSRKEHPSDIPGAIDLRMDVVIPTYNRHVLLRKTLNSLLKAHIPNGLSIRIIVVDNNSTDETRNVVEEYLNEHRNIFKYVFEMKQGRSSALNAGITSSSGDLVGMIDDDEEVDVHWFERAYAAFTENDADFIGGPYLPQWGAPPPAWLPSDYLGVIGWIDGGDKIVRFDREYPGILMGGNAVIKRSVLEKVGLYLTSVSRTGKRLLAGEDEDMYRRLLAIGARGLYLPDLIIYHYIPPERLTKKYFRRWCFWRGVSRGVIDRDQKSSVAYLSGVPRWLYGRAARGILNLTKDTLHRGKNFAKSFSDELAIWDLAGFFYGKHFYRTGI